MNLNYLKNNRKLLRILPAILCFLSLGWQVAGQTTPNEPPPQPLSATAQTLERELSGAQTHQYKFALKANAFIQVRVEQRGIDVTLKLLDANGNSLATMDSPSGKEGFETLSFIASEAGDFVLEVANSDAKAEKATYLIKREALRDATAKDKRRVEVERAFVEGLKSLNTDREASLKKLQEALTGWKELADGEMVKLTAPWVDFQIMVLLSNKGHDLVRQAQQMYAEGREKGNLEILNASKGRILEADAAFREAGVLTEKIFIDHPDFAVKNPGLKIFLYLYKASQVTTAGFLSGYFQYLLEPKEQLRYAQLAASIAKDARLLDVSGSGEKAESSRILTEVQALQHLGSAMSENKNPEAVKYYEQALSAYRELKNINSSAYDKRIEANFLLTISHLYFFHSGKESLASSIEYAKQALALYESLDNKQTVIRLHLIISSANQQLNEIYKSFEHGEKALSLAQALGDKELISQALFAKSALFILLGNEEKSREAFKQGLDIMLSIPDYTKDIDSAAMPPFEKRNRLRMEYARLTGIAGSYQQIKDFRQAIDYYNRAMQIAHQLEDKSHEAHSLSSIGFSYRESKEWQNALNYYQKSLSLFIEIGDRKNQAGNLVDIAMVNLELKKPKDALQPLIQAQQIYSALGADDSNVSNNLAKTWYALGNRRLAIFYNKKLLDWVQSQRQKLKDFDRATQQGFVNAFKGPIRRLADWLIEEGKFAQAEQVLRLLKEEEYLEFVRRDPDEIKTLSQRASLDDNERRLLEKYNLLSGHVSEIGQKLYQLEEKKRQLSRKKLPLSPEEEKSFKELEEKLEIANDAFQLFLDKQLVKEIGANKKIEINLRRSKQEELRKAGAGAVTLYTVVGENRYRVILTTPKVQIDGKYEIKAEELNKKVFAFRAVLMNPNLDPRPLGKELYDILLKPIEKYLQDAGAKTLIWSLDGTLRYIPLAALSPDGKRFLVEDYQNVITTPETGLSTANPEKDWRALGLGVSAKQTVSDPTNPKEKISFSELPGTKKELLSIIRDEDSQNETGVLPGRRLLDDEFTTEALKESLLMENEDGKQRYNLLHVASHFHLGSNKYNSFLLMGNGQLLTLDALKGSNMRFGDTDLVALSACNTAFANDANGGEIDSLAEVIQSQGGKSILATLWAVADESTSLLMSEFYRLRKENPKLTKAEAIQLTQQQMIQGKLQSSSAGNQKGTQLAGSPNNNVGAPPFQFDKDKPFAHPYYWSPFVLIGNWK